MAIYHFSVKTISRSAGRSAVACAAYRSGEKLIDERQGKEQDYTRKTGVEFTQIYAPKNTKSELLDRNQLWNAVEKVERRKDANLAREFEIAFPHELNAEQRQSLLNELCQEIVKRHDVIVDAAIHAPHTASGSDERNYHAHIMFTGRQIDLETGDFAKKRNRDFNKENSSQTVSHWREAFADLTNKHLARAGYLSEVDHRSYADQNNGLQATVHEGSAVTQLRRQGIDTEISLKNDLIKQQNIENQHLPELLKNLEQEIIVTERLVENLQHESVKQSPQHSIFDSIKQNLDAADEHLKQIPQINPDKVRSTLDHVRLTRTQKAKELKQPEKHRAVVNLEKELANATSDIFRVVAQAKLDYVNSMIEKGENPAHHFPAIEKEGNQALQKWREKELQRQAADQPQQPKTTAFEPRSPKKESAPSDEQRKYLTAINAINAYDRAVGDLAKNMRDTTYHKEKSAYSAKRSEITHNLDAINQEIQALGKKPMFFPKKWVSAHTELSAKRDRLERERNNLQEPKPLDHTQAAIRSIREGMSSEQLDKLNNAKKYKDWYVWSHSLEGMTPKERLQEWNKKFDSYPKNYKDKARYVLNSLRAEFKDQPKQLDAVLDQTRLKIMKNPRILDKVEVPQQVIEKMRQADSLKDKSKGR